jgi:Xaa-Pro dipeptidase
MKEFLDIALTAQKAGLDFLKPGNRACDVARSMKEVIDKAGYAMPYRGGHSMGHDLDEPPVIMVEDKTVLQPGMTIVVHPSVMDKNGEGVFAGDSYLVTEAGRERLNEALSA